MKKVLKTIGKIIYSIVILAVVLMALLFVGTKVDMFGYELRVVKSGSMEPAIPTGAVVVIAPTASYEVGDVITYHLGTAGSIPVTHRIIRKTVGEQNTYFATKGDANEDADPSPVAEQRVMGKVAAHVPYVGYAIEFARTPLGFALLIGIPALIIILDEFANIVFEFHKYRFARRQGKVGYRTPSRERRPRDLARPQPQPPQTRPVSRPIDGVRKAVTKPEQSHVLDLRHYELSKHSV